MTAPGSHPGEWAYRCRLWCERCHAQTRVPIPRTAIVPAAGLGTRFLPATKTVPKELLPVVDTPGIELVAEEAAEAGAERLVIITSEGKDSVVAHFVEDLVLEGTLEARGKKAMLAKVRRAPALIKVESVVQAEPLGLGHAIGCVEPVLTADEDAVMVLLPDDLVLPTGVLETMAKVRAKLRRHGAVRHRGDARGDQRLRGLRRRAGARRRQPDVLKVNGMVEKPKAEDAPSMYAAAGRYMLDRADLRCAAPDRPRGRRRSPADRCDRAVDQGGPPGACRGASRFSTRLGKSRRLPQGCG